MDLGPGAATEVVSDNILVKTLTLREAARGYLISLKASRYSERYVEAMEMCLRLLADYVGARGWPSVSEMTASHIEEYLVYLQERFRWFGQRSHDQGPISSSSIETHYRRIKTFFGWLLSRGHVTANPLSLIGHPKVGERVIPTLAEQELLNLLELVDPRDARTEGERFRALRNKAILWLLVDTPIRRAELAGLRVADVDVDGAMVKVMGKGRRERLMPLGEASILALWEYLQARRSRLPQLWLDEHGQPLAPQATYILLKRLGERAGIANLHTHRFRHTFATSYLPSGGAERYLRIVGGWRRIPDTYFRTRDAEDVARAHRQLSPGDRLAEQLRGRSRRKGKVHDLVGQPIQRPSASHTQTRLGTRIGANGRIRTPDPLLGKLPRDKPPNAW